MIAYRARYRVAGAILGIGACLLGGPAHAQGAASTPGDSSGNQTDSAKLAQQRFREATEAYGQERYAAAASLFEAADRLAPHASNRFNAAAAWEQAGELARAATGYRSALAQGNKFDGQLAPAQVTTARQRLKQLQLELGEVRVSRPLGALLSVDHVQRLALPADFYLLPGTYDFRLEYEGESHTKSATITAGELSAIDFELAPENGPSQPLQNEFLDEPPPPPAPQRTVNAWSWVALGTGLVLSGLAVNFGLRANSAREAYVDDLSRADLDAARSSRSRAVRLQTNTNLAWGGAAAAGLTSMILFVQTPTIEF